MEDSAVVIVSTAVSVVIMCLVMFLLRKHEEASRKDPPEVNCSSDFEEWASNAGLTHDTVRILKKEGFTSMTLLHSLTSDPATENLLNNKLPLAQRAALTGALAKLKGDSVLTEDKQKFEEWASNAGLTQDTVRILKKEGFTSMTLLHCLTSDPATENLLNNKLPLAQRAALTGALAKLRGDSVLTEVKHSAIKVVEENDLEVVRPSHDIIAGSLKSEGETLTFLMVGKTGTGKSTTGNTILGGEFFQTSAAFTSVTAVCDLKRATRNGVTIEIMDCPGLFDTSKSHETVATIVVKSVGGMHPGPHAILLMVKIGRFTEEEENSYTRLMALFDERLTKYTIVVFTGGDAIRPSDSFKEMIAENRRLQSIVTACDNRYVIFNNMASDKEPQVDILLKKVRELVAKNGGEPYTCPKYFKIAEAIEEEVKKRMTKVEMKILKKKNYVKDLETRANQATEELEREKEQSQKREKIRKQKEQEEEDLWKIKIENLKCELKHENEETRRQELEALEQKFENERQKHKREVEMSRKQEKENIRRKEEESEKIINELKKEKKKLKNVIKRAREREIWNMKESIANGEEKSLLDKVVRFFQERFKDEN